MPTAQMVGCEVRYDYRGKARSHVMKIGLFGDNYYVIYNSRYMDFWGPLLHLTFFSNVPEILTPRLVSVVGSWEQKVV